MREGLDPLYSRLCHRKPERCYEVCGEPMPVCARCVGVWLGLAAIAVAAFWRTLRLRTGLMLLAWMLASWALGRWMPAAWHVERTVAGLAGGVGLYVVVVRGRGLARWFWRAVIRK